MMLYHVVCPAKYRQKVFTDRVEQAMKEICIEISQRYEINFVEIGMDEDHAHFLVQSVPAMLPSTMVRTIKSITAREIFFRYPETKKLLWGGNFWTTGYYINTVGKHGNEEVIGRYVKEQGKTYKQIYRNQLKLFDCI